MLGRLMQFADKADPSLIESSCRRHAASQTQEQMLAGLPSGGMAYPGYIILIMLHSTRPRIKPGKRPVFRGVLSEGSSFRISLAFAWPELDSLFTCMKSQRDVVLERKGWLEPEVEV